MKNKDKKEKEVKTPLLVHTLIQMHEYPMLFTDGHWDILIGTFRKIFDEFPEIEKFMSDYEVQDSDSKFFDNKIEDLEALSKRGIECKI